MVNDEWSKKVARGIQIQEIKNLNDKGKFVTSGDQIKMNTASKLRKKKGALKRLDSVFLSEQADEKLAEMNERQEDKLKIPQSPISAYGVGKALRKLRSKNEREGHKMNEESFSKSIKTPLGLSTKV